jgi:periplasmic protein CpxP/Spy
MKTLITAIALTAALATPVFASDDHERHQGEGMNRAEMQEGKVNHREMMATHKQRMEKIMAELKEEKDPEKHQKLMEEHTKSMRDAMHMMNSNMRGKHGVTGQMKMPSMEQMDMMEDRVDMVQTLMEQMVERKTEEKKARKFYR